jgi:hypothetical protein
MRPRVGVAYYYLRTTLHLRANARASMLRQSVARTRSVYLGYESKRDGKRLLHHHLSLRVTFFQYRVLLSLGENKLLFTYRKC